MKPGDPAAVEQLFDAVAPRYDRLNDVLSFGLHRQWKRQLVRALKPVAGEHCWICAAERGTWHWNWGDVFAPLVR